MSSARYYRPAFLILLCGLLPSCTSPASNGSITGVVKFKGPMHEPRPIVMTGDSYCHEYYLDKEKPRSQRWVWGKNETLQNVVVYVSKGLPEDAEYAVPEEAVRVEMEGCVFRPHIAVVRKGQLLEIVNADRTLHNPHHLSQHQPPLAMSVPVAGQVFPLQFTNPELGIHVKCDVHAWMYMFVHVLDHPYHAVTGPEGTFEIKGLPPGEYEVSVWHEFRRFRADRETIKVTVTGRDPADVRFTYRPLSAE